MNNKPTHQERLPVVAQLGVLSLILGGLFGALIFINHVNAPEPAVTTIPAGLQPLPPVAPTQQTIGEVSIQGTAAFVWDVRAQKALYKKNPDEVLPLASITKLMTSLLTYELFAPDTRATLPLAAILQDGDTGLIAGEEFRTADLQTLALLASSNDAAFALGATVGEALGDRDPTAQFVTAMNIRAEELGLNTLSFKNTTGLDVSVSEPGAVGSARDITFLMAYIIENYPELLDSTTGSNARVYNTSGAYHDAFNTNDLVGGIPNLLGSKTGYTDLAGGNLTVAFDAGFDRPIIVTVLGSSRGGRFEDVEKLVTAAQASFNTQTN
jgi:D-alanyl-D-alanine carboxypeptidase (penicillin-binding protein 5/6)